VSDDTTLEDKSWVVNILMGSPQRNCSFDKYRKIHFRYIFSQEVNGAMLESLLKYASG
jgi:hypothetical protein